MHLLKFIQYSVDKGLLPVQLLIDALDVAFPVFEGVLCILVIVLQVLHLNAELLHHMELLLFFVDELVMSGFPELLGVSITLIKLVVEYLFLLIETHHLVRIPVARIEYRPIIPIEQTNGLGEHIIDLLDYNIIIITIIMICVII